LGCEIGNRDPRVDDLVSRFLVTGGSGFIGSAVVRRLQRQGHEIVAPSSRELDLLRIGEDQLRASVDRSAATHCVHCAWYTNHADYLVHEVNREWFAASLRLARACRDIRFVALGTCLEYDLSAGEPCQEDRTPLAPETLYARCKRDLFEALTGDFAWPRVFFVYGPGDRAGRLVPKMLETFLAGRKFGPSCGAVRRDYIHVDDLAGQIMRIAQSNVRGAMNTGVGEGPTLSEIVAAGARAVGRPELARPNDLTDNQPPMIVADLARFRSEIGEPQARGIAEGLTDLVSR
jgi:nucleoside-diphosphate-sugar epimerase